MAVNINPEQTNSEQTGIVTRLFELNPIRFIGLSFAFVIVVMILLGVEVRERLIALHQLVIEDDPFQRDEIMTHFSEQTSQFLDARDKLARTCSNID